MLANEGFESAVDPPRWDFEGIAAATTWLLLWFRVL
jgi:hypothetical protein